MLKERACPNYCWGIRTQKVCIAKPRGKTVPGRCGDATERDMSLAARESARVAGGRDCARVGGIVRFELRPGHSRKGARTRVPRGAHESAQLWRHRATDADVIQQRIEWRLSGRAEGFDCRRIREDFLRGLLDGRKPGHENGRRVSARGTPAIAGSGGGVPGAGFVEMRGCVVGARELFVPMAFCAWVDGTI